MQYHVRVLLQQRWSVFNWTWYH